MKEKWKVCPLNSDYAISNFGRVKRITVGQGAIAGKLLKPWKHYKGYLHIRIGSKKIYKVHRLVLETFVGPCPRNKQSNHKDGNKEHNNLNNLEYVTASENIKHAYRNGLVSREGSKNPNTSLFKNDVKEIIKLYDEADLTQKEIGKMYGIKQAAVSKIVNRKAWV